MISNNTSDDPLPVGIYVKIRNSHTGRWQIVEYRGPLGPGGARIYGLRTGDEPTSGYIEVREDQLEILPAES